jgi:hypothetical protein
MSYPGIRTLAAGAALFLGSLAAAQDAALTAEQWRTDIDFLAAELETRHPAPYHDLSRDDFHDALDALIDTISDDTDPRIVVLEIARILASLGETHTYLAWPDGDDRVPFRRYPFAAQKFSDGVFVTEVGPGHAELFGAEILSLGERAIGDVLADIEGLTGADNAWTHDVLGCWRLRCPTRSIRPWPEFMTRRMQVAATR